MLIIILKFAKVDADHCSWNEMLLHFITLTGALITISNLKKNHHLYYLEMHRMVKYSSLLIHS